MTNPKTCCIFNYAPHYRAPIYTLMDKKLGCDFYFGDTVGTPIKEMDVGQLKGYKKTLKRKSLTRWNYFWFKGALKPIFGRYRYYIISGGSKYLSFWVLLLWAKLTSKKVLVWAHGIRGDKSSLQTKLDVLFYKLCHKVLLYGHYPKEKMVALGIPEDKLEVIYNSLDYSNQIAYRTLQPEGSLYKDHFNNHLPVILYIGRIQKSKKLELLLELQQMLVDTGEPVNLVFVGKDIGDNNLLSKVDASPNSNKIWCYGPCYDEKAIARLIQQAHLCISPGPIGLTAIHVATYGLPIITNDNFKRQMPEFEIIEEGKNGAFYKDGDLKSLFQKTREWLTISNEKRAKAQEVSINIIDTYYNPYFQLKLLKQLLKQP